MTDVRRFEIAVEDALVVRGGQARAELARDLDSLVFRQTADAEQGRFEVLTELHREKVAALALT